MTFALEFDTDEDTQRVMREGLTHFAIHCDALGDKGDDFAVRRARYCRELLAWDGPLDLIGESSVSLISDAMRYELDHGAEVNAVRAQDIIDKIDRRFHELFDNLPPGAII